MKEKLLEIKAKALSLLSDDNCDVEDIRIKYLGKKGELTAVLRGMGQLTPEERPVVGQLANEVRADIEKAITEKKANAEKAMLEKKLRSEKIDVTMPASALRQVVSILLQRFRESLRIFS